MKLSKKQIDDLVASTQQAHRIQDAIDRDEGEVVLTEMGPLVTMRIAVAAVEAGLMTGNVQYFTDAIAYLRDYAGSQAPAAVETKEEWAAVARRFPGHSGIQTPFPRV
jgi:hypothetical protein